MHVHINILENTLPRLSVIAKLSQFLKTVLCPLQNFDRKVLVPSPAYGLPTRDTHVLMDEEEEYDMPMPTTYTHSPLSKGKARSATAGTHSIMCNTRNIYC